MTREPVLGRTADWLNSGRRTVIAGDEIFWRQDGPESGTPLTLLHGFPTSSHDWAGVLPALVQAGFRVTTLDLLGFGASAKPKNRAFSLADQTTVVESLWKHLGIERTAVVAHDYSVSIVQELLARDPGRIASVTFLNGGVYPELHRPIRIQRLLHGPAGPLLSRLSSERTFRMAMGKIMGAEIARADLRSMWSSVTCNGGRAIQHALLQYIDERKVHAQRWIGAMEAYTGATQFIWGPDDPISGKHALDHVRTSMMDSRFDELPGVGHYPQIEAPKAVSSALVNFLTTGVTR